MSKPRSQRYRLTFEFVLEDRGAYNAIRGAFEDELAELMKKSWPCSKCIGRYSRVSGDYLAIEKVKDA